MIAHFKLELLILSSPFAFFFLKLCAGVILYINLAVMLQLCELLDNRWLFFFFLLALTKTSVDRHVELLVHTHMRVHTHRRKRKSKEMMRLWCWLLMSCIVSWSLDTWLNKTSGFHPSVAGLHMFLYLPCLAILLSVSIFKCQMS